MKLVLIIVLLGLATVVSSQHNLISTHSFFRDKLFETSRIEAYNGNSFLPVTQSNYNLQKHLKDTSIFYYEFAETAFKKHWFEIQTEDCYLTISPVLTSHLVVIY